jgi:uncharacterized protein (DUF2141 family)
MAWLGLSHRMKGLAGIAACMGALAFAGAAAADSKCDGDGPHLKVIVDGLRNAQGYISVELYPDDPKLFLGHNQQLVVAHDKLDKAAVTVCLDVPHSGMYALAVYHDENGDDQFNRSKLGIPTEGFGLSNNPHILFGLPKFDKVRFYVADDETTLHVDLHYYLGSSASRP